MILSSSIPQGSPHDGRSARSRRIVDPDRIGAREGRHCTGRQRPRVPIFDRVSRELANEGLAGWTDEHREIEAPPKPTRMRNKLEVVLKPLAKADPGIHHESVARHLAALQAQLQLRRTCLGSG